MNITLREVIEAIRKNGLPKAKDFFFKNEMDQSIGSQSNRNEIHSACSIGQAALNLNADPDLLLGSLLSMKAPKDIDVPLVSYEEEFSIGNLITRLNDETGMTLQEIADEVERAAKDMLEFDIPTFSDRI